MMLLKKSSSLNLQRIEVTNGVLDFINQNLESFHNQLTHINVDCDEDYL